MDSLEKAELTTSIRHIAKFLKSGISIYNSEVPDMTGRKIEKKKGFKESKENYRPVSILPIISKIFEKIISKQITNFMDSLLSKYQCGFRRGFIAQNCLLAMLEK